MTADAWTRRYRFHLESVPELIAIARSRVMPLAAARYDGEKVSGGGKDGHVPFAVDAMDDADLLWSLLLIYAREVAYLIGGSAPGVVRDTAWETAGDVAGIRARRTATIAAAEARLITNWLVHRSAEVAVHAQLTDSEEHLFTLVRSLRLRYGVEERPKSNARRCATCGARKVVVVYATVAGMEAELIQCTDCGASGKEAVDGPTEDADLLASSETGEALDADDPTLETLRDADLV